MARRGAREGGVAALWLASVLGFWLGVLIVERSFRRAIASNRRVYLAVAVIGRSLGCRRRDGVTQPSPGDVAASLSN